MLLRKPSRCVSIWLIGNVISRFNRCGFSTVVKLFMDQSIGYWMFTLDNIQLLHCQMVANIITNMQPVLNVYSIIRKTSNKLFLQFFYLQAAINFYKTSYIFLGEDIAVPHIVIAWTVKKLRGDGLQMCIADLKFKHSVSRPNNKLIIHCAAQLLSKQAQKEDIKRLFTRRAEVSLTPSHTLSSSCSGKNRDWLEKLLVFCMYTPCNTHQHIMHGNYMPATFVQAEAHSTF